MVELAGLLVSTPAKRVALTDTLNTSSTGQWTLLITNSTMYTQVLE